MKELKIIRSFPNAKSLGKTKRGSQDTFQPGKPVREADFSCAMLRFVQGSYLQGDKGGRGDKKVGGDGRILGNMHSDRARIIPWGQAER